MQRGSIPHLFARFCPGTGGGVVDICHDIDGYAGAAVAVGCRIDVHSGENEISVVAWCNRDTCHGGVWGAPVCDIGALGILE